MFFIGNTRFGSREAIEAGGWPFASTHEMDGALVERWNEVVGLHDVVYHVGGFCRGALSLARYYLAQLNGYILLVPGEGDMTWIRAASTLYSRSGFRVHVTDAISTVPIFDEQAQRARQLVLCHYPLAAWPGKESGDWHVYAYARPVRPEGAALNVSADLVSFAPISLARVIEQLSILDNTENNSNE